MEETRVIEDSLDQELIAGREKRVEKARSLNLLSDVFMSAALNDRQACQYVLRILLGIPDLVVKEVRVQYRISKVTSHDAVLDVLAETGAGKLANIEIQRKDTVDHARRTRFYGAMIDSEYLAKGKGYNELPDVHILYISETDLWNAGKTCYPVDKYFRGTELLYEDGMHVLYVNAAVDDGSEVARLMKYFKTANPGDMTHGDLSKRVHFLKSEEGGYKSMCEISDEWLREGIEIGRKAGRKEGRRAGRKDGIRIGEMRKAKETALKLARKGTEIDVIADLLDVSAAIVKQWIEGITTVAK